MASCLAQVLHSPKVLIPDKTRKMHLRPCWSLEYATLYPSLRLFADASGIYKGGSGVRGGIYNAAAGVE